MTTRLVRAIAEHEPDEFTDSLQLAEGDLLVVLQVSEPHSSASIQSSQQKKIKIINE